MTTEKTEKVSTEKTETYIAKDIILIGGYPGYQPGDPVSAQVVKDHDLYPGKVKKG